MNEKKEEKFWQDHFVCRLCGNIHHNDDCYGDNGEGLICLDCSENITKKD